MPIEIVVKMELLQGLGFQFAHDAQTGPAPKLSQDDFDAVTKYKKMTSLQLRNARVEAEKEIVARDAATKAENDALINAAPPHVRAILKRGKVNVALLKELLAKYEYDDLQVVDLLLSGFVAAGPVPVSGVFEKETREKNMIPKPKRFKSSFVKVQAPPGMDDPEKVKDLKLLSKHFNSLLDDGLAREVNVAEADCNAKYFPTYAFVLHRDGKKPRVVVNDKPRNWNAVRFERFRLPTSAYFVELALLLKLQVNSYDDWIGVMQGGARAEFNAFNSYMDKVKSRAAADGVSQLEASLNSPFPADFKHWEMSEDESDLDLQGYKVP